MCIRDRSEVSRVSRAVGPKRLSNGRSGDFGAARNRVTRDPVRVTVARRRTPTGDSPGTARPHRAAEAKNGRYVSSKIIPKPTIAADNVRSCIAALIWTWYAEVVPSVTGVEIVLCREFTVDERNRHQNIRYIIGH